MKRPILTKDDPFNVIKSLLDGMDDDSSNIKSVIQKPSLYEESPFLSFEME